jgi:hypothetical protein
MTKTMSKNESVDAALMHPIVHTPKFPLQPTEFSGRMVISLSGVLGRASDQCKRSRDSKHLVYPLTQLQEHINHLRESDGDEQALERLEEFLNLWVKS